jgi:hypothetical protein
MLVDLGGGLGGLPVWAYGVGQERAYGVPPQQIAERMQSVGDPGGVSQDVRWLGSTRLHRYRTLPVLDLPFEME